MRTYRVGLFGCGTVGCGVYRILTERRDSIAALTGADIEIAHVVVRDPQRERCVRVPRNLMSTDPSAIRDDDTIDIAVELIGGERDALGILSRGLVAGKHVVTANKAV